MKKEDFKVGCTVRALDSSGCGGYVVGRLYKVSSISMNMGTGERVLFTELDSHRLTNNGWYESKFRLVPTAPLDPWEQDLQDYIEGELAILR